MSFLKIGMRTIKTVIAIAVTILLSVLMNLESPFIMTLTAFFCLQSTIVESSDMAVKRGGGTIVGGIFSLIYLSVFPTHLIFIPFGILLIIMTCNAIHRNDFIPMAGVIFLVISFRLYAPEAFDPLEYVFMRVIETFLGIGVAIGVNRLIVPPNPYERLESVCRELIVLIDTHITAEGEIRRMRNIETFRLKLHDYRQLLQLCHREKNRRKYHIDLAYYLLQMQRFRTAYSHFYIVNDLSKEDRDEVIGYHRDSLIETLKDLKESELKKNKAALI